MARDLAAILGGKARDQGADFLRHRRPSGTVRVGPLARDQSPVPTRHRRGSRQAVAAQFTGQQSDQRGQNRPVRPGQLRRLGSPRRTTAISSSDFFRRTVSSSRTLGQPVEGAD